VTANKDGFIFMKEMCDMNLNEIINKISFTKMWDYLLTQYDNHDTDDMKMAYHKVFENLKTIEPVKTDMKIIIRHTENESYTGWCTDGISDGETYALDFTAWNEWLGMEIDEETMKTLKLYEIAAHCLWEMTYVGYDEDVIGKKRNEVNASVNELHDELLGNPAD
jgi:hypothetical protein